MSQRNDYRDVFGSTTMAMIFLLILLSSAASATDMINHITVHCDAYRSTTGSDNGIDITMLATYHPNAESATSLELQPENGRYSGWRRFTIPRKVRKDDIVRVELKTNWRAGNEKGGDWRWSIVDPLGTSHPLGSPIPGRGRYHIDRFSLGEGIQHLFRGNTVVIQIDGSKARNSALIDYEELRIYYRDRRDEVTPEWTVMVYMAGDSNLESAIVPDLETELSFSNRDLKVVALADRSKKYDRSRGNWSESLIFNPEPETKANRENAIENLGETDTGDPATLRRFIAYTKGRFPAKHYALVFWGHGGAWRSKDTMFDERSNSSLSIWNIVEAVKDLAPFDIVAFDSCFMANLETQALWKNYASYYIGSEKMVELTGFEYETILPQIQNNPAISPGALALVFGKNLIDYSSSVIDLGRPFDRLLAEVNAWARLLKKHLPEYKDIISAANAELGSAEYPSLKDLADAAATVATKTGTPELIEAANRLGKAFEKTVMYNRSSGYPDSSRLFGTTIFWPNSLDALGKGEEDIKKKELTIYRKLLTTVVPLGDWLDFLETYLKD